MAEAPSAYCETTRKARKDHRCRMCGNCIPTGSHYSYVSGVWDHRGDSYKFHARCLRTYKALMNELTYWEQEEFAFQDMKTVLRERTHERNRYRTVNQVEPASAEAAA